MAPVEFFYRLKDTYFGNKDKHLPVISTQNAALLSIFFTLIYVVPFYLSAATRPSPSLNRDAPSVIRARIQTVTLACTVASLVTLYLLVVTAKGTPPEGLRLLGWWPIHLTDIFWPCALTLVLYLGPLFEKLFVEADVGQFSRGTTRQLVECLSSWQGYRNYVVGPITEEVLFRSVLVPVHLLAKISSAKIVFLTPLYFGIAHVHHFYEFTLTHPHTPLIPALLRSAFQFTYTTLFGWFATFLYLRTGSLYACIIIHAFCNGMGLPRFWGRVRRTEDYAPAPVAIRGKDDTDTVQVKGRGEKLGTQWTVLYYVLLLAGVWIFYNQLWSWTRSNHALAQFSADTNIQKLS